MNDIIILYDNVLPTASAISVTSEATGYAKENAYDWLTWDFWKPTAAGTVYYTVDLGAAQLLNAWGLYAHDLGANGASIKLQYSSDNFAADINDVGIAVSPTGTEPVLKTFTAINARYWRWEIASASVASKIGVLMLGSYLQPPAPLEVGHEPDSMASQYEPMVNLSQESAILGASLYKKPFPGKLDISLLTPDWIRNYWYPFLQHVEQSPKGFLYLPQSVNYPSEVSYCILDKAYPTPKYSQAAWMDANLQYIGFRS